jgi:hypothetical protein
MGIDVRKYAPGGKFGSVDDLLDLVETMKAKGLQDTFKAGKVFHEELTRKFWLQLMEDADAIRAGMAEGRKAMLEDMVGRDVAEIMGSDFGKVQKSKNALQRGELSKPGSKGTSAWPGFSSTPPSTPCRPSWAAAACSWPGAWPGNRYRGGGGGRRAGRPGRAAGLQRVFVVNFPGMGGSGVLSGGKDPFVWGAAARPVARRAACPAWDAAWPEPRARSRSACLWPCSWAGWRPSTPGPMTRSRPRPRRPSTAASPG